MASGKNDPSFLTVVCDSGSVVVVHPDVAIARGSIKRLDNYATSIGLSSARVLVNGQEPSSGVSWWSREFISSTELTIEQLATRDPSADRKLFSQDGGFTRHWLDGNQLGFDSKSNINGDADAWAKRRGRQLRGQSQFKSRALDAARSIKTKRELKAQRLLKPPSGS